MFEERVQDLQTLMYNLHDLVNRYRPHQARESLILMMEERVDGMREEIRRVEEAKVKGAKLMEVLKEGSEEAGKRVRHQDSAEGGMEVVEALEQRSRKARQRAAWRAIEREVG